MSVSWRSVLRQRGALAKPWLILPTAPRESAEHRALSFAELETLASCVADALLQHSRGRARRVILIADNSAECAVCIFATLCAGLVLVPVAPPSLGRPNASWRASLEHLVETCAPALVVGAQADLERCSLATGTLSASFEALLAHRDTLPQGLAPADGAQIALWQSTSGTTSAAKIVTLSHANLLANVAAIGQRIRVSETDVGASWLPLFHDMGLIGALLFSAYWGMPLVLMKPRAFVAHPEAWLWAIDRFRVTCSPAPCSAYAICASTVSEAKTKGLDLSSWRVAFNGAEQVHPATLESFCARYAAHGFRREAMYPVYGLAEHTVAATLPMGREGPELDWVDGSELARTGQIKPRPQHAAGARAMVSVGSALPGHEVRIMGDAGRVLAEREVGEIELAGPSRMAGYVVDAADGAVRADGWLRTGDLGYLVDGKLFVVGRRKHIIKRAGVKVDGDAIESALRLVPWVRGGSVAVFGAPDGASGGERLIVQVEVRSLSEHDEASLRRAILDAVRGVAGIAPDEIALTGPGMIPRTTSGKVRHVAARDAYLATRKAPGATP